MQTASIVPSNIKWKQKPNFICLNDDFFQFKRTDTVTEVKAMTLPYKLIVPFYKHQLKQLNIIYILNHKTVI